MDSHDVAGEKAEEEEGGESVQQFESKSLLSQQSQLLAVVTVGGS